MISNESNTSQGCASWLKWLVATAIALIAAGGSLVAILDYFRADPASASASNPITVVLVSAQETQPVQPPTQMVLQPAIANEPPLLQRPDPIELVVSYWQNISERKFDSAWAQLSPGFRQALHNNNYDDYVRGYQEMDLCHVDVSNPNILRQDDLSAVVTAHFTYYKDAGCTATEYDFEIWLTYDEVSNSWLFDKNIMK